MKEHKSYELVINRQFDFVVKYKFNDSRNIIPSQGYRSDFMYYEDKAEDGLWMIWPEFLDIEGNIITDKSKSVDSEGTSLMWIINLDMIDKHKERISIGQKGFFMEGSKKVAECEVISINFK